jgi:Flp pilus assembly protein TadG
VGAPHVGAPTSHHNKEAHAAMSRRTRDEQGQTMVEFALAVPLLLLVLFAVLQFGVVYNDYVTLTDATRAGARKAAVSRHESSPAAAAEAAVRNSASGLDQGDLDVDVAATAWEHGADVTVAATYPYEIDLLGFVVASGELESTTTERVE